MKTKIILSLTVLSLSIAGCASTGHRDSSRNPSSVDDIGVRVDDQGHVMMIYRDADRNIVVRKCQDFDDVTTRAGCHQNGPDQIVSEDDFRLYVRGMLLSVANELATPLSVDEMKNYKYQISPDTDADLAAKIADQTSKLKSVAEYIKEDPNNSGLKDKEKEFKFVAEQLDAEMHNRKVRAPTLAHVTILVNSMIQDMIDSPNVLPLWYASKDAAGASVKNDTMFFSIAKALYKKPIGPFAKLAKRVSTGRVFEGWWSDYQYTLQFTPTTEGRFSVMLGKQWGNTKREAWIDPQHGCISIKWEEGHLLFIRDDRKGGDGLYYDDSANGAAFDMK